MCGVVGISSNESVATDIYDALTMLQHRGQDAAGIMTCHNGQFLQRKGEGLVKDLRTRAVKSGDDWSVTGNKTWITHATRTHVMTSLSRTDPDTTDYKGLSMLLSE